MSDDRHQTRSQASPHTPLLTGVGIIVGAVSHGMLNVVRRKPVLFEPWWHVICAAVGGYCSHELGAFYDDTSDWMDIHTAAYGRLPAWTHKYLSPERLDSELRPERVLAFRRKFSQLAAAEEALYREQPEDTQSQIPQLSQDFIVPSKDEFLAMMAEAQAAEAAQGAQLQ